MEYKYRPLTEIREPSDVAHKLLATANPYVDKNDVDVKSGSKRDAQDSASTKLATISRSENQVGTRDRKSQQQEEQTDFWTVVRDYAEPTPHWIMIRLVILKPGKFQDKLCCEIKHDYIRYFTCTVLETPDWNHPLGQDPVYEVLSYTWGTSEATEEISVDENQRIAIRVNLATALRYFRLETEPRTLWIDAICIDQTNIEEKNVQVPRMTQIYREALCVQVWLGERSHDSDRAFDVLEGIGGKESEMVLSFRSQDWITGERLVLRPCEPESLKGQSDLTIEDWRSLHNLFQRPWWTRMCGANWFSRIIQEIAYPKKARLICGHRSLNFDTLEYFIMENAKFDRRSQTFIRITRVAGTLAMQRAETQLAELVGMFKRDETNLKTLIWLNSDRESTDPRDQIYALLELACCPKSITVDYSNSKSVRDVYTEATKAMIKDVNNNWRQPPKPSLNIICSAFGTSRQSKYNLPSWVPDFSAKQQLAASFVQVVTDPRSGEEGIIGYNAMGDRGITTHFSIGNDDVLTLSGVFIGRLNKVNLPPKKPRGRHWDFKPWELDNLDSSTYRATGETGIDAFWRTVLFDANPRARTRIKPSEAEGLRDEFLIWSGRKKRRDWVDLEGRHESYSQIFDDGRPAYAINFTFGTCDSGAWGMVPRVSTVGDFVCVARGLSVPVVLRAAKFEPGPAGGPGASRFTFTMMLVGPCYVHGAMDGEIAADVKAGKRIEMQIRIC